MSQQGCSPVEGETAGDKAVLDWEQMTALDADRVAFHEAGHAVAAHLLKRAPGVTTIESTAAYGGLACHGRARLPVHNQLHRPLPLIPAITRRAVETGAMIALAGPAAENLRWVRESGYHAPTPDEEYARELVAGLVTPSRSDRERLTKAAAEPRESDEDIAVTLATAIAGDNAVAFAYLGFLRAATSELVAAPEFKRGIEALVPPLLEHRTLSARAVRALLTGRRRQT